MKALRKRMTAGRRSGFTLTELAIASGLFGLVVAGAFSVYFMSQRLWRVAAVEMEAANMAGLAVDRMVYGIGPNYGLRAATDIEVETKWRNAATSNYWSGNGTPPPATSAVNNLTSGSGDGSWRVVYSNQHQGAKWIDYAKGQRTLVLWQTPNQPASRLLIGHYVESVTVNTNASGGLEINNLKVSLKRGRFTASNTCSTAVNKRNQ